MVSPEASPARDVVADVAFARGALLCSLGKPWEALARAYLVIMLKRQGRAK